MNPNRREFLQVAGASVLAGYAGWSGGKGGTPSVPRSSAVTVVKAATYSADLVDCMVALPGQLFYSTQIPVCLWFLARNKKNGRFRDRRGETLFIDARKMGTLVDRVHRELTDDDLAKIAGTYHAWRGDVRVNGVGANDYSPLQLCLISGSQL